MSIARLQAYSLSVIAGAGAARVHGVRTLDGRPSAAHGGVSTPAWAMPSNLRRITQ